jgi:hypothetical protein
MILPMPDEFIECPACGGAGGGPHGRAGSAWDDEGYVCPRCQGQGVVREIITRPLAKGRVEPAPAIKKNSAGGST